MPRQRQAFVAPAVYRFKGVCELIRIKNNKQIAISRGDSRVIPCRFRNPSRTPRDGTIAVVTLKRDYYDRTKIWEKKYIIIGGKFNIRLTHEDTNLLDDVSYYYDIQLRYPDGQQYTLIPPTEFKILGVVGDADT